MTLALYNTLTSTKEPFRPSVPGQANVYVCGPTVYDYAHLGHARCYIVYDVLVRHLRNTGTDVCFARNITDIDDKILKRAAERGEDPALLAGRFAEAYREDMAQLGNLAPDIEPKVSEHLDDIVTLVSSLIKRGHAYVSEGDVYFSVASFPDYGKLSHRKLKDMKSGASERLNEAQTQRKKHPADFALWKSCESQSASESPSEKEAQSWGWESPWGRGRPGWHIECSAMAMKHLGETLDLHGGGLDLVFPHHENEIAQSEAATGKPFATCWMHNGFVEVDKAKMSKSVGNFFTARDLFKRIEPEAIRYFMMTVHYRAPLNLDWSLDADNQVDGFPQFEEAERRLAYLYNTKQRLVTLPDKRIVDSKSRQEVPNALAQFAAGLTAALDDDLNMPVALATLAEFLKAINELCDAALAKKGTASRAAVQAALQGFELVGTSLGLGNADAHALLTRIRDRRAHAKGTSPSDVEAKIATRNEARRAKDFETADRVRKELAHLGVELHDGPEGTHWTMA